MFQKLIERFQRNQAPEGAPVQPSVLESAEPKPLEAERRISKIKEALSQTHNPFASFGNAEHPVSRKELANVLALLICHLGDWRDLGANEFEVAHSIGRLIDSFEPSSVPDK